MFTGLVEAVGTVKSVRPGSGGTIVSVDIGALAEGTSHGDSVAINGVCLTVSASSGSVVDFDVSSETMKRSSIKGVSSGAKVNLERAMSADGRFGGHIVQGHIDGTATIRGMKKQGEFSEISFSAAVELLDEMVVKGSVAIDGISLTVSKMDATSFSVSVIPTTLKETTLGNAKTGDTVNIETDIVVKTIKKQLKNILPGSGGLTEDKLRGLGF